VVLTPITAGALAPGTAAAHDRPAARGHEHAAPAPALTARQRAFHDSMRKLWEDHITWTRLAIVSFAGGLPDLQATEAQHRLQGDFAADIRDYEAVHRHILKMADTLSAGIMRQFPKRFR
jgi:hypothetical protein